MTTLNQATNRDFAKSVGMTFGDCEMCELLTMESRRSADNIRALHRAIQARDRLLHKQRKAIGTLKLACFAATLMMVIFGWATIAGRAV